MNGACQSRPSTPTTLARRRSHPLAQSWRARRRSAARHDPAALHRHARVAGRAGMDVLAAEQGLGALLCVRGRPHRAMRAGSVARLACRRKLLGQRHRHQFLLDRHRDRQSRSRPRLSGFPGAADRGGDGAVPQHHQAPAASRPSGCSRIPTSRPDARKIPARNFPGASCTIPASAIGSSRCRSCRGRTSRSATAAT